MAPKTKRVVRKGRTVKTGTFKAIAKKEAKAQVEKSLKKKMELKHFDSAEWRSINPFYIAGNKFSCVGFSSTNNTQPDGGAYQYPSGHNIYQLQALKPFHTNALDPILRSYSIEGRQCNPLSAKTIFNLQRDPAVNLNVLTQPSNAHTLLPPDSQTQPLTVAQNCPVICRVIRVTPKLASGINTEPDPAEDLFINRYGTEIGVNSSAMDEFDVFMYGINTRRYKKISDFKFKLNNPYNISWQAVQTPDDHTGDGRDAHMNFMAQVMPNSSLGVSKDITVYDQLAKKKGGAVYYKDVGDPLVNNATSGHQRIYTFFHFMYQGADTVTGQNWNVKAPIDVIINSNTLSRFTDA
jgi:hypothetical protein